MLLILDVEEVACHQLLQILFQHRDLQGAQKSRQQLLSTQAQMQLTAHLLLSAVAAPWSAALEEVRLHAAAAARCQFAAVAAPARLVL
jgi:hypothetical protein